MGHLNEAPIKAITAMGEQLTRQLKTWAWNQKELSLIINSANS